MKLDPKGRYINRMNERPSQTDMEKSINFNNHPNNRPTNQPNKLTNKKMYWSQITKLVPRSCGSCNINSVRCFLVTVVAGGTGRQTDNSKQHVAILCGTNMMVVYVADLMVAFSFSLGLPTHLPVSHWDSFLSFFC